MRVGAARSAVLRSLAALLSLTVCTASGGDGSLQPPTMEETGLPLLAVRPLEPEESARFVRDGSVFELRRDAEGGARSRTDIDVARAEEIGRAWILQNVGPMPPRTGLVLDAPSAAQGLVESTSIVFHQTFDGYRTSRVAVLWFAGSEIRSAWIELGRFEPIDGTARPTITADAATALLLQALAANAEQRRGIESALAPRLVYDYAGRVEALEQGDGVEILAPHWEMLRDFPLMVDAHTGRVWRND